MRRILICSILAASCIFPASAAALSIKAVTRDGTAIIRQQLIRTSSEATYRVDARDRAKSLPSICQDVRLQVRRGGAWRDVGVPRGGCAPPLREPLHEFSGDLRIPLDDRTRWLVNQYPARIVGNSTDLGVGLTLNLNGSATVLSRDGTVINRQQLVRTDGSMKYVVHQRDPAAGLSGICLRLDLQFRRAGKWQIPGPYGRGICADSFVQRKRMSGSLGFSFFPEVRTSLDRYPARMVAGSTDVRSRMVLGL